MITYNADQKVMDRFPNYKQVTWDLTYTMRHNNSEKYKQDQVDRKELILLNYT
jgi:hypothetical protein